MSRLQRCAVAFAIAPHAVQDRCVGPDACIHAFALTPSARDAPCHARTRIMMQSCASAAKLRSGGPILPFGVRAKGRLGIPPPRTVIGVPSQAYGQAETVVVPSASFVHCAGRKTTPSGTMPSRMSRHRAISSLRAKATIMGFRVPRAFSVRDRNHFVKALFFWCRRNRHAN